MHLDVLVRQCAVDRPRVWFVDLEGEQMEWCETVSGVQRHLAVVVGNAGGGGGEE